MEQLEQRVKTLEETILSIMGIFDKHKDLMGQVISALDKLTKIGN